MRLKLNPLLSTLLGIVSALVIAELMLRPFVGGAALDGKQRGPEYRQYNEGLATSHFMSDYARSTGNPIEAGAPVGLILGDSHVEAIQIDDRNTLGSRAERALRAEGIPINVRQYGWGGVAVPKYLETGPLLLRIWKPRFVVVVINRGSLGERSLTGDVRLKIMADAGYRLIVEPPPPSSRLGQATMSELRGLAHASSLVQASLHRSQEILQDESLDGQLVNDRSMPNELDLLPKIAVQALKNTFGDKLLIVYLARVDFESSYKQDPEEKRLLEECKVENVRCASTRLAMLAERDRNKRFAFGFSNSQLASGHMNELGHEIVADLIVSELTGLDKN